MDDIYNILFFILNDIFPVTDYAYIKQGIFSVLLKIFYIKLTDLTLFSDRKNNLGLFSLKSYLNIKLYCNGVDINSIKIFLNDLKLYK